MSKKSESGKHHSDCEEDKARNREEQGKIAMADTDPTDKDVKQLISNAKQRSSKNLTMLNGVADQSSIPTNRRGSIQQADLLSVGRQHSYLNLQTESGNNEGYLTMSKLRDA